MKILKLLLSVLIVDAAICIAKLIHITLTDDKLSTSICKIANDITHSKVETQNVLLGTLGGKAMSLEVQDIAQCVADENPVVVLSTFHTKILERKLWKASVIILIFDSINEVNVGV
ncbi:hypothetical protein ACKWTF_015606 [Chironomus riparius]